MPREGNDESRETEKPTHILMLLKRQLKALLRDSDLTVAQLSRATGISSKTIYNWLAGQSPRDIEQVKKVADHLAVSLDWLCYGSERQSQPANEIEKYLDEVHAGVFEVILRKVKK